MNATSTNKHPCRLCGQPVTELKSGIRPEGLVEQYTCKCCGTFNVLIDQAIIKEEEKYLLSAAVRMWTGTQFPILGRDTIPALVQGVPRLSVLEKLDLLLELAAQRTPGIGLWSSFDLNTDYPLIVARNQEEIYQLAAALKDRGLVRQADNLLFLKVPGWERLEEIRRSGSRSSLVFVAMWFEPSTLSLYEQAIRPAIREAGYEPLRIDQHEHVNRIDDEIIGQMRRSKFMVADFTGQRPGVYFEAGFMMGLGRNVIWMCSKSELEKLHFDVRQYSFVDWESIEDARTRLKRRILSLEGEGPRLSST
jgi:hypothetical protein